MTLRGYSSKQMNIWSSQTSRFNTPGVVAPTCDNSIRSNPVYTQGSFDQIPNGLTLDSLVSEGALLETEACFPPMNSFCEAYS